MTVIENLQPRVQYVYSTSSQVYNITFPYIERQYVKCMVKDQELTYNVHYQVPVFDPVSLETDELYLTLLITPTTNLNDGVTIEEGDLITIYRETPIDQQAEFPQTAKFSSQKITEALDKLTLQQQEQQDDITRCLKLAKNVPDGFETSLPSPVGKNYIRWSDDGSQLINYDLEADMNAFKQDVNDAIDDFESDVEDTLSDFQNEINTTKGIANNAVSIANGAVDTADAAEQTAETALSNSQTAINTANTAEGKANSAISTANTADANATTALTKANQAVSTANTADTNASTALTKANQAITDSATAVSTAEDAVETAESAVETADDALEYATAANTNAASALSNSQTAVSTANTASTNASTALSNSQTAVSTANSASAKVDEFGEDIEQVIEAAEKINELEEAVETAVGAATDATTAATNATTAATNATTAATTATQKAQEATQAAASIVLNTYRVVYGTTTFSQVSTAIQEGKVPLLDMGNNKYGTLINKYTNTTRQMGIVIYSEVDFYVFCIPSDTKGKCTYAYLILGKGGDPDTWVSETLDITEQANWTQNDDTALDYIKNKPTIPAATNVKINGTTITSDGVANILTNSAYNSSSNKIATMSDMTSKQDVFKTTNDLIFTNFTFNNAKLNTDLNNHYWYGLAYGDNKFVAIGNSGYISTSTDGITWTTAVEDANLGSHSWRAVAYYGTKFVAIGSSGWTSAFYNDSWHTVEDYNLGNHTWSALAYGNNKLVALGSSGYVSTHNGITWTTAVQNTDLGNHTWSALAYGNNKFVALGSAGYISTSTDGTTWTTAVQNTDLGSHTWYGLAYDGTKFVAIGNSGYISTSTDGTTWTTAVQTSALGLNAWQNLAYDGTKFVALSYGGYISTSVDGLNLSLENTRFDGQWKPKFANISTTVMVNSYTHDLSNYLPNDNQAYEIFVYLDGVYESGNAEFAIGTTPNPVTNHLVGNGNLQLYNRVTNYSKVGCSIGILPVGVGTNAKRTIYSQITGTQLLALNIYIYGYRRIGTNN